MNNYPDYNRATNAAYEILAKYNGSFPQISLYWILTLFPNVKVHTYTDIAKKFNLWTPDFIEQYAESDLGFTIFDKKKNHWIIYYNDLLDYRISRFTIAHELGHIVLNHWREENFEDKEANCFARNLLCPVPMRQAFNLTTVSDYCSAFNISDRAAEVVIDRNSSDEYYITKENYDIVSARAFEYFTGYNYETYCC